MNHKWLIGSTLCTLLGILAGMAYLSFAETQLFPLPFAFRLSGQPSEWLLFVFGAMLALALLLNLIAFFELEFSPSLWRFWQGTSKQQLQERSFGQIVSHYLSQQRVNALSGVDGYFLTAQSNQERTLICTELALSQPLDIQQLRQLFQQMLIHQCRRGQLICFYGVNSQARLFAQEAGIEIIDHKGLKRRLDQ